MTNAVDKARAWDSVIDTRRDECAKIAAWLRSYGGHLVRDQERALLSAADAIERGDHRKS